MQFLGLEKQRTLDVVADVYCEIASIAPDAITNKTLHERLHAYGLQRQTIELKISSIREEVSGAIIFCMAWRMTTRRPL